MRQQGRAVAIIAVPGKAATPLRAVHDLWKTRLAGQQTRLLHAIDQQRQADQHGERHPAGQYQYLARRLGLGLFFDLAEFDNIIAHAAPSTRAVTPCPPAVHTEISARLPGSAASNLAVSPRMRAPV